MHINLHLTTRCNLGCDYCYAKGQPELDITPEIIEKAVAIAMQETEQNKSIGIVFFGGEPLLRKDLIKYTLEYCQQLQNQQKRNFHYKITTNGLLLDEDFLELANKFDIQVALSFDGIKKAHDLHRFSKKNDGIQATFEIVKENALKLLKFRRYSAVMMTVNPDTVEFFAESVKFLYQFGFRKILSGLNYLADWNEEIFENLKNEYEKIADFYLEKTLAEDKFIIGIIDNKIAKLINPQGTKHSICSMGLSQVSVAPDGNIFPCVQFLSFQPESSNLSPLTRGTECEAFRGLNSWCIGDVFTAMDNNKRLKLFHECESEKQSCKDCEINHRCEHFCGCINKSVTGSLSEVAPAVCANERIIVPTIDKLVQRLYDLKAPMFIQKYYNEYFPLISVIEDMNHQI